jgi:hypothetical protein
LPTELGVALRQLARMRGMNATYHARFFSDIRFTTVVALALFAAGFALDRRLFLAIPGGGAARSLPDGLQRVSANLTGLEFTVAVSM